MARALRQASKVALMRRVVAMDTCAGSDHSGVCEEPPCCSGCSAGKCAWLSAHCSMKLMMSLRICGEGGEQEGVVRGVSVVYRSLG